MRNRNARIATGVASAVWLFGLGIDISYALPQGGTSVLMRGPVDDVDLKTSQLHILGQWILVRGVSTEQLMGHVVSVEGEIGEGGSYVVSAIEDLNAVQYVPGATSVFLSGVVTSLNRDAGILTIGGTTVNFAGALHSLASNEVSVGSV